MQSFLNWREHQDEPSAFPSKVSAEGHLRCGKRIYISSIFPGDIDGTGLGATLRTSGQGNNSESGRGDTVSLVLDSQTREILSKFLKCPGLGLLTCKTVGGLDSL